MLKDESDDKAKHSSWRSFIFGLTFGGVVVGGAVHWADSRRVTVASSGHVAVDGTELPQLEVCTLGCETEADDVCRKFITLIKRGQ